jgi:hypothetical protein
MKDIKSFCKLFDLNVPNFNEFDYYINQYKKLWRWKDMDDLISLYESAESQIEDIFKYKIDKSNEIIDFLKNTRAYNELNDDNLIPDLPTNKNFTLVEGKKYLSIDLKMANWQVLKKYDPSFLNELGDTYSQFLDKFNIHPVFHKSKHFRQYIFGNLNPKRQIKAQRVIINDVINRLSGIDGLNLEFIKNDEVVFSYNDITSLQIRELEDIIKNESYNVKIFKTDIKDDFRINIYLDFYENELYRELTGCNGSKYFIFLKKYILNESLDVRDLYFRFDGDLAIWNIDNLKVELND